MSCHKDEPLLRVGELAHETGKSIRTLHYYEELGLLRPAKRTDGGFRLYAATTVGRVRTIGRLQELSVPLGRIKEIVEAWSEAKSGREAASKAKEVLAAELADTRHKIRELRSIENELDRSLGFLSECSSCDDEPHRDRCSECAKGSHVVGQIPEFIDAFLY